MDCRRGSGDVAGVPAAETVEEEVMIAMLSGVLTASFVMLTCYLGGIDFSTRNFGVAWSIMMSSLFGMFAFAVVKQKEDKP